MPKPAKKELHILCLHVPTDAYRKMHFSGQRARLQMSLEMGLALQQHPQHQQLKEQSRRVVTPQRRLLLVVKMMVCGLFVLLIFFFQEFIHSASFPVSGTGL